MKVQLLGTAATDGWPNPFCICASCEDLRQNGVIRAQSSALIDECLRLECGPDLPRGAERQSGIPLLIRQGAKVNVPLNVIAPPLTPRSLQQWVLSDNRIEWIEAVPFRPIALGDYVVVPLLVNHETSGELGILPLVTDGVTFVLWAPDTGPFSDETIRALSTHPDHLNLNFFGEAISQLKSCGAITKETHIAPMGKMDAKLPFDSDVIRL